MENSTLLTVSELRSKFRLKNDLYKILSQQSKLLQSLTSHLLVQYLIPSYRKCSVKFMKDILSCKKKVGFSLFEIFCNTQIIWSIKSKDSWLSRAGC